MGPLKHAWKMLKLEYKKTLFYAFTLFITVAVVFLFMNMANNPYLGNNMYVNTEIDPTKNSISFSSGLSIVMITLSILAAVFSNSVYLDKKVNEIAIYQISGSNIIELAEFLVGQNFIVGGIAIPLGIIFGYLLNGLTNMYIYTQLNASGNIWYVSSETVGLTFFYIVALLMAITMLNAGFAYRNDILTLLNMDKSIKPLKPATGIRMPVIVYWILVFVPFYGYIQGLAAPSDYIFYSLVGIVGVFGLYSRGIPSILEKVQAKFNLSKPKKLISIGNLKYSVAKTKSLVLIIIFSIVALTGYCINYKNDPQQYVVMFTSYIVTILLVTLMILYKIMLENDSHSHIYGALFKLGYTRKKILSIIKEEVFYYYALLLFFISVYTIPILVHFINIGEITVFYAIRSFLIYFVPLALSSIIAYLNYKSAVFKGITIRPINQKEDK